MSERSEHEVLADIAINLHEFLDEALRDKIGDPNPTHCASVLGILNAMVSAQLTQHLTGPEPESD